MKKETKDITNDNLTDSNEKRITRKEAIKKTAYIALSAATMMILLSNPDKAQAAEASPAPVAPFPV